MKEYECAIGIVKRHEFTVEAKTPLQAYRKLKQMVEDIKHNDIWQGLLKDIESNDPWIDYIQVLVDGNTVNEKYY